MSTKNLLLGLLLSLIGLTSGHAKTGDDYLQDAQNYLEQRDFRAAIIQLKNALKVQPNNAQARWTLGKAYYSVGDIKGAEKELKKARDLGAPAEEWMIPLGEIYLLQGRANDVLAEINPHADMEAGIKADLFALRANAYLQLGKQIDAQSLLEQALSLDGENLRALLGQARLAMLRGDLQQAIEWTDKALQRQPDNVFALTLRGELARLSGDGASAGQFFSRALEINGRHVPALLGRVTVAVANKDYQAAREDIARIKQVLPDHSMANYFEALIHYQQQDYAGAEKALQRVFSVTNRLPQAQLLMGAVQYAKGQYEQARDYLTRFNQALPDRIEGSTLLAATLLRLGKVDKAIRLLTRLESQYPDNAHVLGLLGNAYLMKREVSKATEYLEKAAQIDPGQTAIKTQLGLGYLGGGETALAIDVLKSLQQQDAANDQSGLLLIVAYLRAREFDNAFDTAQKLAEKKPDNPLYPNFMGVVRQAQGRRADARVYFGQALRIDPGFAPAHMSLARLAEAENKRDEARKHYQAVLKHHPKHSRAMLALARLAAAEGDNQTMLEWLLRAREAQPERLQPGLVLARYYVSTRQPLKALEVAQDLSRRFPDNPLVLETQGLAQLAADEKANAVATFRKLVKQLPDSARARLLLARALMVSGDRQAAGNVLAEARKIDPGFAPVYRAQADLMLREKRYDDAMRLAGVAKQRLPGSPLGWEIEGDVHAMQKHYAAAVAAYEQAYGKQQHAGLLIKLANAQFRAGDIEDSIAGLRRWLVKFPGDFRVRLLLANQLQAVKRNAAAIENYEKLLAQRPDYLPVINNLAWLYNEQGDARALRHAERAYEMAPDNPAVMDTYGWVLLHQGDKQKALRMLQQASMKAPHVPEIKYHLAVALNETGQREAARIELERLLKEHTKFPGVEKARILLDELTAG